MRLSFEKIERSLLCAARASSYPQPFELQLMQLFLAQALTNKQQLTALSQTIIAGLNLT
jgi:hypothetical protein